MAVPRSAFMALRLAQFTCAAVVLGLAGYLLHLEYAHNIGGPFNRLIYSAIIAATSLIASLIWLISSTLTPVAHTIADLLFCGAWFAVFGLLQDWYEDVMRCGSKWDWNTMGLRDGLCGKWNAIQAFSFMAAIFWFASFVLGIMTWKKHGTAPAASDGAPATTGRKRWLGRSRV
ncbi:hypothetical protein yc1106_09967 [Curvularia clavata]|uniref:MARVEL domain-containing protein n=1 Tax=Curvularia clavata TaxID=95742 RepID=A0A9Q8ZL54_CURCL|nr:hypothetical protein yc1106_09967 [Curvularia clavata]